MNVRVVTVTYRAGEAVVAWLDALQAAWGAHAQGASDDRLVVVAVDNASPDDTPEILQGRAPFVTVLAQPVNRGFAAGCNIGLRTAEPGEIIIVMNPDVLVSEGFFQTLAALDWAPELAARGPQVLGRDGTVEQSARTFPTLATGLFGRTSLLARALPTSAPVRRQLRARPEAGAADVDWISGACMIAPHDRWAEVGHFDERYYMYWEDADWCRRAHEKSRLVRYEPSLVVHHRQGSSSSYRPLATIVAFHRSAWIYHRTHSGGGLARDVVAATALALRASLKLGVAAWSRRRSDTGRR